MTEDKKTYRFAFRGGKKSDGTYYSSSLRVPNLEYEEMSEYADEHNLKNLPDYHIQVATDTSGLAQTWTWENVDPDFVEGRWDTP